MADVARATAEWVGGILGVETVYGDMPGGSPACMVKAEAADPIVKRYLDGGCICRFSYGVYLRVRPLAGPDYELDGLAAIGLVASAVNAHEVPDIEGVRVFGHEVTNAPALYMTEQDGGKLYQLTAEIKYYEKR